MNNEILEFVWTVSKARDSYGYNIMTLYVNDKKVAQCNGGGYDMKGTVLGQWIATTFKDQLLKLKQEFCGLTYHDPNYDPNKEIIKGQTIAEREKEGKSLGLERYQAFYAASSKLPTEKHIIPEINGATGFSSVEKILKTIGCELEYIPSRRNKDNSLYKLVKRETQ